MVPDKGETPTEDEEKASIAGSSPGSERLVSGSREFGLIVHGADNGDTKEGFPVIGRKGYSQIGDRRTSQGPRELVVSDLWVRILPESVLSSTFFHHTYRFLTSNATSDEVFSCYGIDIFESTEAIRLFKFLSLTIIMIAVVHPFVRWMDWEIDPNYTLRDFFKYDFNMVLLDACSFFVVGRLFKRRGVDCFFPFIVPMLLGTVYASWCNEVWFLRHSVSMFEIMCNWPWQLFAYTITLIALVATLVGLHIKHAVEDGILCSRLLECVILVSCFILPYASDPNFHLHHWYGFWLLGMVLNQNYWWSMWALGYCWGQYINGIAVYGRDPILGCEYGYYISTDIRCSYMACTLDDQNKTYAPFQAPDWRNCSASGNYIP